MISAAEPMAGWSDANDPRRNNFDALRFLLAATVVYSHSYSIAVPRERWTDELLTGLTGRQISSGSLAVHAFFVISGFLIAQSWVRSRGFGDFIKRRALRLYPGFAAVTLFCALAAVPLATGSFPKVNAGLIGKLAYRTLVLDAWDDPTAFAGHHDPSVNASVWTIPYEFWCYVAVAGLAAAGVLRRRWCVAGLFVAMFALARTFSLLHCGPVWQQFTPHAVAYHAGRIFGTPAEWPNFLTYFLAGTLFYLFRDRVRHSNRLAAACAVALVAAGAVRPALQFVLPVCGTYLLFWAALHPRLRLEKFGRHGDFSYGIYLYAFPIQQLVVKAMGVTGVNPLALFAVSLPLAVVAGALSWHGVEKRFLRRRGVRPATVVILESVPFEIAPVPLGLSDWQVAALARGEEISVPWEESAVPVSAAEREEALSEPVSIG
jgi:peptidoglycan/LPS O-acetylase OafA/YrhL